MKARLTRRKAAAALLTVPGMLAQAPTQAPASEREQLLTTARKQARSTSEKLAAYEIPMATEPAFQFRA